MPPWTIGYAGQKKLWMIFIKPTGNANRNKGSLGWKNNYCVFDLTFNNTFPWINHVQQVYTHAQRCHLEPPTVLFVQLTFIVVGTYHHRLNFTQLFYFIKNWQGTLYNLQHILFRNTIAFLRVLTYFNSCT